MKLSESKLRSIIKEELQRVLNENVGQVDVQKLSNSFDELKYVYDDYDTEKIYKFNKGKNIGELTQSEIDAIDEAFDMYLSEYDIVAQAQQIGKVLGKNVSAYKYTEEEHLSLRLQAAEKEKKKWADLRRKNDEYIKKHNIKI